MSDPAPHSLLFVCTGNICRSPMAHGIAARCLARRGLAGSVRVDSAGLHPPRAGMPAEPLAIEVAAAHGVDLLAHRARAVQQADFLRHRHIYAMDLGHLDYLQFLQPPQSGAQLALVTSAIAPYAPLEVDDPYGGTRADFERAYALIERAVEALLAELPWAQAP